MARFHAPYRRNTALAWAPAASEAPLPPPVCLSWPMRRDEGILYSLRQGVISALCEHKGSGVWAEAKLAKGRHEGPVAV